MTRAEPTRSPLVRLVVLNYNGGDFVVRCVEALTKLDWPAERLQLVVVDNLSTDGSIDVIEERFSSGAPAVRVVRNTANTGFPANNLALRDLDGVDYVGLVNSDAFVEPDWLHHMVGGLESDDGLGAVSARMLFADRFVEVAVSSPTFVPGVADGRELGVMVSGVRVDGVDRWRDAQVAEGGWGLEHGRDGTFEWTRGHAVVRVPIDVAGADSSVVGAVRLAAEAAKVVTLRCGDDEVAVDVEVGVEPGWFEVRLGGEPVDVVNNVGSVVFEDGSGADRGYLEVDRGQYDEPAEVFAWCGGSVLFRPAYLDDVGLFDERYFLYYEDTDLSWRGQSRGWRYRYVPGAVTRHIHAASTGEGSPLFQHYVERNRLYMLVKNAPRAMALRAVWRYLLVTASYARRDLVRPVLRAHRPNPTQVLRRVKSFLAFLGLLPGALMSRRRIRRAAKVSDEVLLGRLTPMPPR